MAPSLALPACLSTCSCVVHYQLPASVDVYVHRSGRTARAEAEGLAIALVTPKENARFQALLRAMGREESPVFPLVRWGRGAWERGGGNSLVWQGASWLLGLRCGCHAA